MPAKGFVVTGILFGILPLLPLTSPAAIAPQPIFPLPLNPELGTAQRGVAIGDVNGDGKADVVLGLPHRQSVVVLLGNGDGTFAVGPTVPVAGWTADLKLADLNRDGILDLITANDLSSSLSVLLGATDGGFELPRIYRLGSPPQAVVTGDFNGDGRSDVAVALLGVPDVAVLLAGSDGAFTATNLINTGSECWSLAAGDLDNNGTVDLVAAGDYDFNLRILAGRGTGSFNLTNRIALGIPVRFVTLGDFNRDQKLDLLALTYDGQAVILLNQGANRFAESARFTVTDRLSSAVVGDFNGDGNPDFVCSDGGSSAIFVPGNGNGTFGLPTFYWTGPAPGKLAAADLNGDGKLDLVSADDDGTAPGVLIGRGDGSFRSVRNFPIGHRPLAAVVGDLNHDGIPDVLSVGWDGAITHSGLLSVALGTGDGRLVSAGDYEIPPAPSGITLVDFNRDGDADVLVCSSETNLLARFQGDGDGHLSPLPPLALLSSTANAVGAGDFNQDQFSDIVVASADGDRLEVRLNDTRGGFGPAILVPVGQNPQDVTVGNINKDGRLGLATANRGDQSVTLLRVNGDATFTTLATLPLPGGGQRVLLADVDGDENPDVVVASGWQMFDTTTISVFWGSSDGRFLSGSNYPTGLGPGILTAADFNGDGLLDLAVGNQGNGTLTFLLGQAGRRFIPGPILSPGTLSAVLAGDLDGDGRPDVGLLSSSGSCVTFLLNGSVPPVTISPLAGAVRVSWPAWRGLALETADRVNPDPAWTFLASNAPVANGMRTITNDARNPLRFFRLTGR